jgi:hypothetical protein
MVGKTIAAAGGVEADVRWRNAILAGDEAAWHDFVHRHSDQAVETAIRWCDAACMHPGGCSLKRGPGRPFRRFLDGDCRCDRVGAAYTFILEKLREKLAFYRGERGCRLDTWVRHLLIPLPRHVAATTSDYGYRQLFADYVRKMEGRIRAPAEILRGEPVLEQVYLLAHYGRDDAAICEALDLTPAQLDRSIERIEELLRRKGADFFWRFWGHLWVPKETDSLSQDADDDGAEPVEPRATGTDPHTGWEAAAIEEAITAALASLAPLSRHLLWLAIDRGLTAPTIAADLRARGLARWSQRRVYGEIDRALAQICADVSASLAHVDEVTIRPREMKSLLEFWSVERFLARRRRSSPSVR